MLEAPPMALPAGTKGAEAVEEAREVGTGGLMFWGSRQENMTPTEAALLTHPGIRLPHSRVLSSSAKQLQLRVRM